MPAMASARVTIASCHCKKCNVKLFEAPNDWLQLPSPHLTLRTSVDAPNGLVVDDLETITVIEPDLPGTGVLSGCDLRKIFCVRCEARLGVKCVKAREDKRRYHGKGIIKSRSICLRSLQDQTPLDFQVSPAEPVTIKIDSDDAEMSDIPPTSNMRPLSVASVSRSRLTNGTAASSPLARPRQAAASPDGSVAGILKARFDLVDAKFAVHDLRFNDIDKALKQVIDEQNTLFNEVTSAIDQRTDILDINPAPSQELHLKLQDLTGKIDALDGLPAQYQELIGKIDTVHRPPPQSQSLDNKFQELGARFDALEQKLEEQTEKSAEQNSQILTLLQQIKESNVEPTQTGNLASRTRTSRASSGSSSNQDLYRPDDLEFESHPRATSTSNATAEGITKSPHSSQIVKRKRGRPVGSKNKSKLADKAVDEPATTITTKASKTCCWCQTRPRVSGSRRCEQCPEPSTTSNSQKRKVLQGASQNISGNDRKRQRADTTPGSQLQDEQDSIVVEPESRQGGFVAVTNGTSQIPGAQMPFRSSPAPITNGLVAVFATRGTSDSTTARNAPPAAQNQPRASTQPAAPKSFAAINAMSTAKSTSSARPGPFIETTQQSTDVGFDDIASPVIGDGILPRNSMSVSPDTSVAGSLPADLLFDSDIQMDDEDDDDDRPLAPVPTIKQQKVSQSKPANALTLPSSRAPVAKMGSSTKAKAVNKKVVLPDDSPPSGSTTFQQIMGKGFQPVNKNRPKNKTTSSQF